MKYWMGTPIGSHDDFKRPIGDEFVDGRIATRGCWAIMSPLTWSQIGCGQLGTSCGQRYKKQPDGRWLKVEG